MASKQIETLTGIFVIGFFMVLIAIVIFYTTQGSLERRQTYVLYFSGSLSGLQVGSPVQYRGVKVGEVTRIQIVTNRKTLKISIPIYIHFLQGRDSHAQSVDILKALIEKGLRAELISTNILTGTRVINLVMRPNTPMQYHQVSSKYIEIPTIAFDPKETGLGPTIKSAEELLKNINQIVSSPAAHELLPNANKTINSTNELIQNAHQFTIKVNKKFDPLSRDTNKMLMEVSDMAASIKTLAEYLSRHPESIIIGKSRR